MPIPTSTRAARELDHGVGEEVNRLTALIGSLFAAGCGGGAGALDATAPLDGGEDGATAAAVCARACATLIGCGVQLDASCATECQQSASLLACVQSAPDECNALSLCIFAERAAACPGGGGVPIGGGTCSQAAQCERACNAANQGIGCDCLCIAGMAASKAFYLLINNQCAIAQCAASCVTQFDGAGCNACTAQSCAAQFAECVSH
jgi:hypothetical protein